MREMNNFFFFAARQDSTPHLPGFLQRFGGRGRAVLQGGSNKEDQMRVDIF